MTSVDELLSKIARVIGGEDAVGVIMALKDMGEATDDQVLAKTSMKLNDIRKILFKFYNHSIVQCNRQRDERTGWFIFRWKLQQDQIDGFIRNQKKRIHEILETRFQYERDHVFYYCNTPNCERITFENAMELVFHCPNCTSSLIHYDNSIIVNALKERINILDQESLE